MAIRMKKRILSLFFAIIMTLSSVTFVSAASPSTKLTPKTASETVALSFMKNSLSEAVKISETTPYYDLDGNVTAYCISFSLEGKPSGYVLISLLDLDNPIVEFSFDGNGITNTIRKMQNSVYRTAGDRIIFLGAGALFVQDNRGDNLYDVVTHERYSATELDTAYKKATGALLTRNDVVIADGILNWVDSGIDSSTIEKIQEFGSGTDYWLMSQFSTGNVCSPTCATNILWYWGVQRGRSWAVVNGTLSGYDLAEGLFTAMRLQMGTVSSLGTLDVRIRDAYTNFLGFRGTNFNTRVLTQNSYSSFTDAIDDQCPVHTMLRNQSIFSTGHDVMTFGYGQSTSGTDYLFVMDGWYSYGRFVNFDFYPIVKGVKVWVGSTPN